MPRRMDSGPEHDDLYEGMIERWRQWLTARAAIPSG